MCPDAASPREHESLILRQHGRIARLLRELGQLLQQGAPPRELLIVVRALVERFREHFDTEDQLMRLHGYPAAEHHLARHAEFRGELERICKDCEQHSADDQHVPPASIHRLEEWFAAHEGKEDRALLEFLAPSKD